MKFKLIAISSVAALAASLSACGGGAANTVANKPANATNTTTNTTVTTTNTVTNTNTTANTNAANTAAAPAAEGQVIKIDEAGIQMTVPKGFSFSKAGEDTVVKSDDEGVEVRFSVPEDGDYEKAVGAAAKELDSYLDDVKIENNGGKVDVNGMEGTSITGIAKDSEGENVNFDLTIIKAPKAPVLATIYAEKASMEKHGAAVHAFLKSVKKQ